MAPCSRVGCLFRESTPLALTIDVKHKHASQSPDAVFQTAGARRLYTYCSRRTPQHEGYGCRHRMSALSQCAHSAGRLVPPLLFQLSPRMREHSRESADPARLHNGGTSASCDVPSGDPSRRIHGLSRIFCPIEFDDPASAIVSGVGRSGRQSITVLPRRTGRQLTRLMFHSTSFGIATSVRVTSERGVY
jgi:hypothetical protein